MIKEIKEFPGYGVSEDGKVWTRKVKRSCGRGGCYTFIGDNWREMKPTSAGGYPLVTISKGGKPYYRKVHRLVLEEFVGPCPANMEACHNDNNRLNNHVDNLRWGTKKSNYKDREKNGTENIGEGNGRCILNEEKVLEIRRRLVLGESQEKLGKEFHVTQVAISHIHLRKTWKHI